MRLTNLVLFFLFACVAGLPHLYLESRQNNGTALMKRGNVPGSESVLRKIKTYLQRHDPEAWVIDYLRAGGSPGWIKQVCTDPKKTRLHETEQTRIHSVEYTFHGITIFVVVKEVRWEEKYIQKEIDVLNRVHDFLGHGYNKRTKARYLVMRYLGISAPPSWRFGDHMARELAEAANERYKTDNGLIRVHGSIDEYTFLELKTKATEYIGHALGSWRNVEVITSHPKVPPLKISNYEVW